MIEVSETLTEEHQQRITRRCTLLVNPQPVGQSGTMVTKPAWGIPAAPTDTAVDVKLCNANKQTGTLSFL